MTAYLTEADPASIPITGLRAIDLPSWRVACDGATRAWLAASAFEAPPCGVCVVPTREGGIARVLVGVAPGELVLLDQAGQPSRQRHSATADADEDQVIGPTIALDNLVRNARQRASQVVGIQDLRVAHAPEFRARCSPDARND